MNSEDGLILKIAVPSSKLKIMTAIICHQILCLVFMNERASCAAVVH